MSQKRRLHRLICRLRGHKWNLSDIPAFNREGKLFVRESRVVCLRCSMSQETGSKSHAA